MSPATSVARPPGLALVIVIAGAVGLVASFALTIDRFHSVKSPRVGLGFRHLAAFAELSRASSAAHGWIPSITVLCHLTIAVIARPGSTCSPHSELRLAGFAP